MPFAKPQRHPLDGDAIAADEHYEEIDAPLYEGAPCPEPGCAGILALEIPDEDAPRDTAPFLFCAACGASV